MGDCDNDIFYDCGQRFYILSKYKWSLIFESKEYEGLKIGGDLISQVIDKRVLFAEKNKKFRCAITKQEIGKIKEIWIPILFYQTEEGWQRVGIEKTKCIICGWKGSIANPTLLDLYLALPERFELIRKKSGLKKVGCPKCGSELNRFAIWAE